MTSGETEETCGGQEQGRRGGGRGGGGGSMKLSVTALSTIAIQAGQSLMIISVLKSGSLVHLQLVQVHPALCEIGSNHEETQTLIQEQQQLMDKLKKHEDEVLSVVEKNQQTEEKRRRRIWDEGLMKRNKKQEEEEAVCRAMVASVKEGWSLLLRLLQRRQEVFTLAADFHRRALEFANSIDRLEALQIGSDDNDGDRLTELQLTYDSMRKDILGRSLQVLSSSSVLLHKLRHLQRTEALQRRGGVLQEEEEEEEESSQSSQCSRGVVLRLEQLVESLQDRRRRVDQAARLQLQQVENCTVKELTSVGDEILTINEILDQDLESRSTSAESVDLRSESRSSENVDLRPESRSSENVDLRSESRSSESVDLRPESRSAESPDLRSESRSEETNNLKLESRSEETKDLKPESRSDLRSESRSEKTRSLTPQSKSEETKDPKPESRSEETRDLISKSSFEEIRDLTPLSISEETRDMETESRSDLKSNFKPEETRDLQPPPRLDQMPGSRSDLKLGSRVDVKTEPRTEPNKEVVPGSISQESRNIESGCRLHLKPESRSDLKPRSRSEDSGDLMPESKSDLQSGFKSDLQPGLRLQFKPESRPVENRNQMSGSRSEESRNIESGFRLHLKHLKPRPRLEGLGDLKPESSSELKPESRPAENREQIFGSRSEESRDLKPESRSELKPESRPAENKNLMSGSRPEEFRNIKLGWRLQQKPESRSDLKPRPDDTRDLNPDSKSELKPESRPADNRNQMSESRSEVSRNNESGFRLHLKIESRSEFKPESTPAENRNQMSGSRSEESRNIKSGYILHLNPRSRSEDTIDLKPEEARSELKSESRPVENREQMSGSRSDLNSDSKQEETRGRSEETQDLQPESRSEATVDSGFKSGSSAQVAELETQSGEDHAHQTLLTNQRLQLLSSCEQLLDKVCSWVQQSSSVLSNSCEAGRQLSEAEDTLNTHLQLRTQAESVGHDAEKLKQTLDQIRALHTTKQLSPLKALTEQLKRGSTDRRTRTGAALPGPSLSPELTGRVDLVLKDLQSLNKKINSNLQLLKPYVTFLRTAQKVEQELEELREIYRRRPEEDEAGSSRSSVRKKQVDACWQEALQSFFTCQELGNNYIHTATTVSGATLNLQSLVLAVQQTVERLSRTKQEVNELQSQEQIQIQQQQEYCRKYREKLHKTLQDLNCVSEMLDSCTLMDLGSDLQTSRLQQHFSQARPHFTQLDAEVEFMVKSWETVRGVQDRLEVEELKGGAVKEENLSELLKLQERVKNKIHQSESILDLTSSFHLTSKQLEALLQSDPGSPLIGSTGSDEAAQIQGLFKITSTLKTEICTAVNHTGGTCFRVQQLEARLLSLDSLCVSWQNEAARREEKLRRELLTRLLSQDINQLRNSFKELKKRFSNLRFNYLKRNDRTRNTKAVRNQLQQVELYEEKLQALRKRLQGVTARLGSEVKDGGVAREAEDAVNELQRQMGEFERSISEHQKTLEMTCKLQQAMEEYQFWCEDASATIARVGKFSSECRSTEAVSVLYRQFEKFVWPTVPQQEERISQITELAVRLHGAEEGRRFIEKTVSKHSEMVEAIRELSDGLMKLEAKLKLESVKQQQVDREKEMKEEKETEEEEREEEKEEEEEKDEEKEKKWKKNRKLKKEQTDNRSTQEYELKETGHTPELTTMHDGKEVPVKRQIAANKKPPLQKSRSEDADSRQPSTYCSTHTFSLSCSPAEANRRVHAIHSQSQATASQSQATPPPAVIGPLFSDIQREFQRKDTSNMTPLQDASAGGLSEAELQQQEVMTEDSLSNDEYDCASPDDISLPPLAETPESNMVQSDIEESFCFSSHSVHINQYSHQSEHSSAGIGTGAASQQKESIQNESCPTPPTRSHSSTRFRSESSSFVQSPLTVPAPSVLTTTLCSILKTGKTGTANVSLSVDLSLGAPEPSFPSGSNPVHKRKTPDNCSDKELNVPEKTSPSKTDFLLKEHRCQNNQPQRSSGPLGKTTQNVASKEETLPQTDPIPQVAELNQGTTILQSSYSPQPFTLPDPDLHRDKTPPQDTEFLKCSTTLPQTKTSICQENSFSQSFPDPESDLHQDLNSSQIQKETSSVSKPQRYNSPTSTSTITQQSIYFQSLPQVDPVPQARGSSQSLTDSVLHENKTQDTGLRKSFGATSLQTSTTLSQDSNTSQSHPDSRSGLDKDVPSPQTCKETSSVFKPKSSFTTATTVTQQTVYCQSSPSDSHFTVPQASSNLRSQQDRPSGSGGLPEANAPIPLEPNSVSSVSISSSTITSSNRFSSKQSHQTVYSFHESLTSTCTQQCVHDPGMTPGSTAKPAAPPQPKPHTQALAQQANPHVTPLSSPPHLLTPDQDPNICQPVAIREEIRLTPQIQGPSLPAPPPPQAQAESLPQGKASKPGPPCFTRPLSRATVMEGSPVTLEVEVTGQPEPSLTWCTDGEPSPGRPPPSCEDGEHFLLTPETSDSDVVLYEARAAGHPNSSSSDKWLVEEVFDIISEDVQTWFGTLCVLLWLLYLILL